MRQTPAPSLRTLAAGPTLVFQPSHHRSRQLSCHRLRGVIGTERARSRTWMMVVTMHVAVPAGEQRYARHSNQQEGQGRLEAHQNPSGAGSAMSGMRAPRACARHQPKRELAQLAAQQDPDPGRGARLRHAGHLPHLEHDALQRGSAGKPVCRSAAEAQEREASAKPDRTALRENGLRMRFAQAFSRGTMQPSIRRAYYLGISESYNLDTMKALGFVEAKPQAACGAA